jgi:hypothetical protein
MPPLLLTALAFAEVVASDSTGAVATFGGLPRLFLALKELLLPRELLFQQELSKLEVFLAFFLALKELLLPQELLLKLSAKFFVFLSYFGIIIN